MRKASFKEIRSGGRKGYNKHTKPEMNRLNDAISGLPYFCDIIPNDGEIEDAAADLICNIKHLLAIEGIEQERVFDLANDFYKSEVLSEQV